jgi:hypothetical protein
MKKVQHEKHRTHSEQYSQHDPRSYTSAMSLGRHRSTLIDATVAIACRRARQPA